MIRGVVQFFLIEKGYGYIRVPETKEEFFVEQKHILEPIKKGDLVSFEIAENKQGLYATQVRIEKPKP